MYRSDGILFFFFLKYDISLNNLYAQNKIHQQKIDLDKPKQETPKQIETRGKKSALAG